MTSRNTPQRLAAPSPTPSTSSSLPRIMPSNSSLPSALSVPSSAPITIDAILEANASAPNPTQAALGQAVSERNALSSQNSQLWKLIEKQRAAYNILVKEIDRIRSERDASRSKLQALGQTIPEALAKRDKDKDRVHKNLRPAISSPSLTPSSHSGFPTSAIAKAGLSPDDRARSASTESPARQPSPRTRSNDDAVPQRLPHSTSTSQHAQRTPPPLHVPKRGDSLLSEASSASPDTSTSSPVRLPLPPGLGDHNRAPSPSPTTAAPIQPLNILRKKNEDQSSLLAYQSSESPSAAVIVNEPPSPSSPSPTPTPHHTHTHTTSLPQNGTTPSHTAKSLSLSTSSNMLSPGNEGTARTISRESRVSIPPEAREYIASMADSPMPSPEEADKSFHFPQPQPDLPVVVERPPRMSSLPPARRAGETSVEPEPIPEEPSADDSTEAEFLELDEEDADDAEDDNGMPPSPMIEPGKARAEDFPLPPSYNHMGSSMGVQHASPALLAPGLVIGSEVPPSPFGDLPPVSFPNKSSAFRELPLLSTDLPHTTIQVTQTSTKPNDRGKEVLSFTVLVDPGHGKEPWRVEKLYSDVMGLDARIRASVGKGVLKKIGTLPEGKLFRDHAPAKVDQRKAALETYLKSLIDLPIKNKDEVIAFFTSDVVRETRKPVSQAGYKEGYLTKRGKNFGGWKTRYFVLQGPVLEYYESRGGAHLGSILITGAQIGRQQRGADRPDEEKEYRHAFLVIEAKKTPTGGHRHVLCAESDAERDAWVDELVRYVMGAYNEQGGSGAAFGPSPIATDGIALPRSSSSSWGTDSPSASNSNNNGRRRGRKEDGSRGPGPSGLEIAKGQAVPISQLAHDPSNAKLFGTPQVQVVELGASGSADSEIDHARRLLHGPGPQPAADVPLSSSLPTPSPLDDASEDLADVANPRSNSELGNYADMRATRDRDRPSPDRHRPRERKSFHPSSGIPERELEHTPREKVKMISGPMNGTPIPAGYKFGKEAESAAAALDRKEKAKSKGFWGFGRPNDKSQVSHVPRAVFGVPLDECLDIVEIENLPAIVYRCIQYLDAKKADQEEGIYRLNGSTAVIKALKDRFNAEGDVDLLASDEFWDPHAIAGLLKSFLRELPASILTRDLHLRFLAVIDFDPEERIKELSQLIRALPPANYSLLRALTVHLILIVQNASVNKMNMRNVGIVFSPTLGIPAGVFSLMLGEFNRVFNVEDALAEEEEEDHAQQLAALIQRRHAEQEHLPSSPRRIKRLSRQQGAEQRTPRNPVASSEDAPSDSDDFFVTDESGTETTEGDLITVESQSPPSVSPDSQARRDEGSLNPPTKASQTAANLGLSVALSDRGNRHSRVGGFGLPASPRPMHSPNATPR